MIKQAISKGILLGSLLATIIMAAPRIHFGALPPAIRSGSLTAIAETISRLRYPDVLVLRIDSLGGSVQEYLKVVEAKQRSKGTLVCYIGYEADSAAAMIMQLCDKVHVKSTSRALFHMPRYTVYINSEKGLVPYTKVITADTKDPAEQKFLKFFLRLMSNQGVWELLTKEEKERVLQGEDISIPAQELAKRQPNKFKVWK